MGRPYAAELDELDGTYTWALDTSVEALADTIGACIRWPLIAVGSGGSLTAAHFACFLHTQFTGRLAQVFTPYELLGSPLSLEDAAVLVLSAGGRNPDILACVEDIAIRLPRHLAAITTTLDSPLSRRLEQLSWPTAHAFATPTRKDGFLATNSLLATLVVLTRAYSLAIGVPASLPPTLDSLVHPGRAWQDFVEAWTGPASLLLHRRTLVVLHGGNTKAAAADIESRFTEAALGSVQVADFRNFAHGRHHWLAANGDTSAVLALSSPEDRHVAKRTLALIPKEIPRLSIDIDGTIPGVLSSICQSLYLAYIAGKQQGIDPGRPHVPMFGRKLYHLSAKPQSPAGLQISERMGAAIQRKAGLSCDSLARRQELDSWCHHYQEVVEKLRLSVLDAVVFDYDGTLCGPRRRFEGPSDEIMERLTKLLKAGLLVGIATGRGKSVQDDLRKRIRPAALRRRVVIAYHNGAEIGALDDVTVPPDESPLVASLQDLAERLLSSPEVTQKAEVNAKGSQITIQLSKRADASAVFEALSRTARDVGPPGVTVVSSTHSLDVLAPGISKRRIIQYFHDHFGIDSPESRVLCIGDRGRWPGNDADLLNHSLSLSVDEVSRNPQTCWNLSAPGQRYDLSCLEYLDMLVPAKSGTRFNVERLQS